MKKEFYVVLMSFQCFCVTVSDLRYNTQSFPQAVKADVSYILPPYVDVPPLRLVEAEQQTHDGALPANQTWKQLSASFCLCAAPPQSTDDI